MSVLKRLCLLVFGLCSLFSLAALALPWFGPWTEGARLWLAVPWCRLALEVTLGVSAFGVLVVLLRAVLTPRRRKVVEIGRVGGDVITVTCAAVSSQATHIVEQSGPYMAERVRVRARRRSVRVGLRVRPRHAISAASEGPRLHDALMEGLALLVGDAIDGVDIEFVEVPSPRHASEGVMPDGPSGEGLAQADGISSDEAPTAAVDQSDITVPMRVAAGTASPMTGVGEGE